MKKFFFVLAAMAIVISSCDVNKALEQVNKGLNTINTGATPGLTSGEIINALKDALMQGTNNSTLKASALDGFNKNPKIRIPFPPAAVKVKEWAIKFGMKDKIDKFEETLNRAAEEAAKGAGTIFVDAVKTMTIGDGLSILKGADTSATNYLRKKCTAPLNVKFKPTVHNATEKVKITQYWNPIITAYNKLPNHDDINPDLDQYVCDRGIDGLFKLIGEEETKIRIDPVARATDIMKKVFGSKDNPHNN